MASNHQLYYDILDRIPIDRITDHPNILVAAGFWEEDRFQAAKTCYGFMRKIDDLIDDYKASHKRIDERDRSKFEKRVGDWLSELKTDSQSPKRGSDLARTLNRFRIPFWPMEDFARSMIYDINHDGFADLPTFLDYSNGATVAPSSVFVHLCGIRREGDRWLDPLFDVKQASTPCAIFSYLVHTIRDFQKDQLNNLNCFADDRLEANGLDRSIMRRIAGGGSISQGFRTLMEEYYLLADDYRQQTWKVLKRISPLVEPRYHLSLLIIFNLYLMVFERIDIANGVFTAAELNPTAREIHDRVRHTIDEFLELTA